MNKLLTLLAAALLAFTAQSARAEKIDFAKQIRPIFAESCYKCHGPEKQKGDYRLDKAEAILKLPEKKDDKRAVTPGKPDDSDLLRRITLKPSDEDAMPPENKGEPLKPEQVALIKQWISEGAEFGTWTFDAAAKPVGPVAIVLPKVAQAKTEALTKLHEVGALAMPLARDTNLIQVNFRAEADKISDSQLALLDAVAEQVYDLNLASTKITDAGLAQLKGLKNLRVLHLEKTGVTDAGIASLTGLKELRYLNLYGTKVTDACFASIKTLPNLEKLYLWDSKVTEAGVEAFKKEMPKLQITSGFEKPPAPVVSEADKKAKETFVKFAPDFKAGGCCDKANKAGSVCDHPCCKEALAAGKLCEKCNPPVKKPAAPAVSDADKKLKESFTKLSANFTAGSCCEKAHKAGNICDHPCCKEALAANKACEKCNKK